MDSLSLRDYNFFNRGYILSTTIKNRVLTGSRPSGPVHLGNYLGAFKPCIELSQTQETILFIADLHTMNVDLNAEQVDQYSLNLAATYIACGFDPVKNLMFRQSAVPEVTTLNWLLNCVTPYGMAARAHSFKDAQAKSKEVNLGVFNYPILMAADVLLYDATLVPVGKDQKQHIEMTRDIATRFNNRFGEVLTVPEILLSKEVEIIPGIDGEKMSSSKNNVISLFATKKSWKKQIMGIVTDSTGVADKKDPEKCNVFNLIKILGTDLQTKEIADKYRAGGYGYGHAKLDLLSIVEEQFGAMSERYHQLISNPSEIRDFLEIGKQKARVIAEKKLSLVFEKCGLSSFKS